MYHEYKYLAAFLFVNQQVSAAFNRHLKVDYKFKSFLCKNIKKVIPDGLRDLTKDLVIRQCTND